MPCKFSQGTLVNIVMFYFQNDFIVQNLYSAHEEAISTCEEQGLKQAVYFLKRDLMFIKEVYQM